MKVQIVFATGNADKVREIREIIQDPEVSVYSMKELGISSDPEETGTTFEENARIKARAVADILLENPARYLQDLSTPIAVLSDDSGLVVDALGGAPGIYSARFLGRDTSYTEKMNYILSELKDKTGDERSARFVCACAAVLLPAPESAASGAAALEPAGHEGAALEAAGHEGAALEAADHEGAALEAREIVVTETMEGQIADRIAGEHGFGYDPVFYLPEYGKTSAELTDEEKNAISHRGKAFRAMTDRLRELL